MNGKTAITIALILAIGGIVVVNMLNTGKAERQETTRQYEIEQERKYDACVDQATRDYSRHWKEECEGRGLGEDCRLPTVVAEVKNESYSYDKLNCIKMYKK